MKGIIDELETWVRELHEERGRLEKRLGELRELEDALRLVLNEKNRRLQAHQLALLPVRTVNGRKVIGKTPLSRFLVRVLADGSPRSLKELAALAEAEGMAFNGKNPRRVLHFALIGLRQNGYAEMPAKSIWRLTARAISKAGEQQAKIRET